MKKIEFLVQIVKGLLIIKNIMKIKLMKLKEKQNEEEKNNTFKPKINKNKKEK